MRIVITGATSMIGTALMEECVRHGDEVLAIIRENTKRRNRIPDSTLITVEYANLNSLEEIQGDGKSYDVFYHLAWGYTSKKQRDLPLLQEENIKSTLQAVEVAHRLGCFKFIGAGSQAECGYIDGVIDENVQCHPVTAYGMAKLAAYELSRKMCEQLGMMHIWGRIFSVYGIHDNDDTMIDYALNHLMKGEVARFSQATNMWNYLYESDAGALFYHLGAESVDDGIYNVASPESKPLREYIKEIEESVKTKGKIHFEASQNDKMYNLDVDVRKIMEVTGYVPKVNFKEGISKVVENKKRSMSSL